MTEEVKKEIAEAAVKLAEHVHKNKFESVLVSGGSNQLSRSLFTLAWQDRFKGEKMPNIYIFDRKANSLFYKNDDVAGNDVLKEEEVLKTIKAHLPQLEEMKNKNLCYIDDFAMTGGKFVILKRRFRELEMKNISFAFFGATPITELSEDTFVGTMDLDTTRELQGLSQQIQGHPSLRDILQQVEFTAENRRLLALNALKEVGQQIRMK